MTQGTLSLHQFGRAALAAAALLALAACNAPPKSSFYNRGAPESLLDVSSEVVNLSVRDKNDIQALSNWIEKDAPSRAELMCDGNLPSCQSAVKALEARDVNVSLTPSPNNTVTLVYERIVARDCNSRYLDNGFSVYGAHQPSFGCAIAANMVQQVSDKREFINPAISDDPSAVSAVSAYRRGMTPTKEIVNRYGVGSSTVSASGSSQ